MYQTWIAYLLWFFGGFGALGLHRMYLGKVASGLFYIFTGGGFVIGSIYDFITMPAQVSVANMKNRYRMALDIESERKNLKLNDKTDRNQKKESLERVILKAAKKNNGLVTPSDVALEGDISLEEAKKQLEKLVSKGFSEMRVTKSGTIVYLFNDFATDDSYKNLEEF